MRLALIGCGYVADMYIQTLRKYEHLHIIGVYDRNPERLAKFTAFYQVKAFASLDAVLTASNVDMIINLTNPSEHYGISRQALLAGKHVYSEKPLATTLPEATELAELAKTHSLGLAAAPCNYLSHVVSEAALQMQKGRIGRPLMAQAEMDDGFIPALRPETWRSPSGAPWPAKDEFEVGCTMEHAGYQIAPLVTLFGPVTRVVSYSASLLPDKARPYGSLKILNPDFSTGMLEFKSGFKARLTCSIVAPANRSLRLIGDRGALTLSDVWEYQTALRYTTVGMSLIPRLMRKLEKKLSFWAPGLFFGRKLTVSGHDMVKRTAGGHHMDFARGIADLAHRIKNNRDVASSARLAVHVTEVTLALQAGEGIHAIISTL